jgi:hypothetical protein
MTEKRHEQNEHRFRERLERLKMEQMKDCTFKPDLNHYSQLQTNRGQSETMGLSQYEMQLAASQENTMTLNY